MELSSFEIIALAGTLILLVTGLAQKPISAPVKFPSILLIIFLISILTSALGIQTVLDAEGYKPSSPLSALVPWNSHRTREAFQDNTQNILIIEGGSHAARGIDPGLLEEALRRYGLDVLVVSFAVPGANHIERLGWLECYARKSGLSTIGNESKPSTNVVLMREANSGYDERPLEQLRENPFTDRSLAYLGPHQSVQAIGALLVANKIDSLESVGKMAFQIAQHGLANAFNIGGVMRLTRENSLSNPSYSFHDRQGTKKGFTYDSELGLLRNSSAKKRADWLPQRAWKAELVDQPLQGAIQPDKTIFFAVPTLRKGTLEYLESYKEDHPNDHLISFRDATELHDDLNKAEAWYDSGHLANDGARAYTLWLAQELHRSGALRQR